MTAHFAKAQVNGIDLDYRMLGTGPPLLLLHGDLSNADYWISVVTCPNSLSL